MKNFAMWLIRIGLIILILIELGPVGVVFAILLKCIVEILKKKGIIPTPSKKEVDEEI